jgi:hypothetical protein
MNFSKVIPISTTTTGMTFPKSKRRQPRLLDTQRRYVQEMSSRTLLGYKLFFYTGLFRFDWQIWDRDGKAPTEDLDWDELSKEQQEAAKVLGYNKEKWDSDD